jgi:Arc/MetJ family transcription regulator
MRSTIELPDDLLEQAMRASGLKTKRAVIERALEEALRRWRLEQFSASLGKISYDLTQKDLARMRSED